MRSILIVLFALSTISTAFSDTGVLIIGDTGKDNENQGLVAQAMKKHCQTDLCHLGMLAGDNVYPVGVSSPDDTVMERVFDKYYNVLNVPFLIALGNHDYGKLTNDWKRGSYQMLHAKKNPLFYMPDFYYSYETPEAVIAVIDTTRLMWNKDFKKNAAVVEEAFKKATEAKKWFMVLGHHPYLSNGHHGNAGKYDGVVIPYMASGKYVKKFFERHICNKAHFYISGHDHLLEVFDGNLRGCSTQLIVSGAAASDDELYAKNPAVFESREMGFFHMIITPEVVKVKAINKENKVLFQQDYTKKSLLAESRE